MKYKRLCCECRDQTLISIYCRPTGISWISRGGHVQQGDLKIRDQVFILKFISAQIGYRDKI